MSGWTRVAADADLPDERAIRVDIDGVAVCLARSEGEVFAINDRCTHAEVSLSDGEVEGGEVECWLHGSRFDLRSGQPDCLPAVVPVATYAVKIDGGNIFVDIEHRPADRTAPDRGARTSAGEMT